MKVSVVNETIALLFTKQKDEDLHFFPLLFPPLSCVVFPLQLLIRVLFPLSAGVFSCKMCLI